MMEKIWHKSYDKQVLRSIPYRDQTVYQLFQDSVDKNPQGIATLFFEPRFAIWKWATVWTASPVPLPPLELGKETGWPWFFPIFPPNRSPIQPVSNLVGSWSPPIPLTLEGDLHYR